MFKRSVCWNITPRCNVNCKFCYRNLERKEINLEQNKEILKILSSIGVDKITFSGGECLLYPNLLEILKMAHELNITTSIITNGISLNEKNIKKYEDYVDYLILSIDAIDDDINEKIGRGRNQGKHILKLIEYISNSNSKLKIKLNTVVENKNLKEIKNISKAIKKYPIVRWKLFKFYELRGNSLKNGREFSITNEQYDDVINQIREEDLKCKIKICKDNEIQNDYFLVDAEGNFCITVGDKDEIICNYKNINIEKIKELLWN